MVGIIAAIVGTLAAVAAALIAAYQVHLSRFSLGVDMTLRLDERFESPEFLKKRCAAAYAIRRKSGSDIEDVLDFFESLGLLTRRRALDQGFVYSTFFYWLHGYASKCQDFIAEQRKQYPARYGDLVWLHGKLVAIEESRYGPIQESEWDGFLDDEENLCNEATAAH
ncbi:MAG: hypothetical protein ABSG32_19775 [Terriglobia bacterium]